jgi:hypothetical protein
MKSENIYPHLILDNMRWDCHWQMSVAERCILQVVLGRLKPRLSVEIGTYKGGSLQVISEFSDNVIAVDVDKSVEMNLGGKFPNVEFCIGDSASVVPALVAKLNKYENLVDFVLIDGDHSAEGVKRDIEAVLGLHVEKRIVILMHDSFNPDCRRGMLEADWARNPHVHFVEIDFSAGNFHLPPVDTAQERSMWGGFACAVLDPTFRDTPLIIGERQRSKFEAIRAISIHAPSSPENMLLKLAGKFKRRFLH